MHDAAGTAPHQVATPAPQPAWVIWLSGTPGLALAFLWGLAEGTFFFVIPDVAISLAALVSPRRAWHHVLAAITGSVLGGALMFGWDLHSPTSVQHAVARVPFVTAKMFATVHASYQAHGMGAVFLGPLSGTPYKIYAIEAPEFLARTPFLLATIPARGERFLAVWAIFGIAGTLLRRYLGRTAPQLALGHGVFWAIVYAFYWGRIVLQ